MEIERFDPVADTAAVRVCHGIQGAAARADGRRRPGFSAQMFRAWLTHGLTEDPIQCWLARDAAGEAAGFAVLVLPEQENRHTVDVAPVVHPAHRRAGAGTALVALAADCARQAGRTLLTASTDEPSADSASAGQLFARALGARYRITGFYRVLRLGSVPAGRLAALRERADAAAAGYSLLTWEGPTPGELLDGVAEVFDAEADAPHAPGEEPLRWDAARVRADERRVAAQGVRLYTVAARPASGGVPVAITQLVVDPAEPGWGFQELTAVVRPHRDHRLGLLVKLGMLDLLAEREPQLTQAITHNADGNEHMIAINADLGFEILERNMNWEIETARVPALADLRAGRAAQS